MKSKGFCALRCDTWIHYYTPETKQPSNQQSKRLKRELSLRLNIHNREDWHVTSLAVKNPEPKNEIICKQLMRDITCVWNRQAFNVLSLGPVRCYKKQLPMDGYVKVGPKGKKLLDLEEAGR
ncbi:hypothetical protein LAZ67_13002713 [Cordylochernes scorpioides]|uniref:Uncharacterized protein n=1 Tax=Cordylochernes scorpioides TaxID=51811 RepID=A0ABY6L4R2_9ARAC|nr:hypothetical protein LAZ67_13002713 [Cordylochernes scorpioides]